MLHDMKKLLLLQKLSCFLLLNDFVVFEEEIEEK